MKDKVAKKSKNQNSFVDIPLKALSTIAPGNPPRTEFIGECKFGDLLNEKSFKFLDIIKLKV